MIHFLKIQPKFYEGVCNGTKTFEIRNNDRGFQPGDELYLREYIAGHGYTGRNVWVNVKYVLTSADFPQGLKDGYCAIGIEKYNHTPNLDTEGRGGPFPALCPCCGGRPEVRYTDDEGETINEEWMENYAGEEILDGEGHPDKQKIAEHLPEYIKECTFYVFIVCTDCGLNVAGKTLDDAIGKWNMRVRRL